MLLPHPGSPTHTPCPSLQYSPHHWHITRTFKARVLQLTVLWSSKKTQLTRLQHIQNSLARAVVAAPRSSDTDQILKSLHWLKVQERIENKIISTTYNYSLPVHITIQPSRSTRSSSLVTLLHPQAQSSLKITNRSFRYAAPQMEQTSFISSRSILSVRHLGVFSSIARLWLCS